MAKGDPVCCGSPCTILDGLLFCGIFTACLALIFVSGLVIWPYCYQQSSQYVQGTCQVKAVRGAGIQVCYTTVEPEKCTIYNQSYYKPTVTTPTTRNFTFTTPTPSSSGNCSAFPCVQVQVVLFTGQGVVADDVSSEDGGSVVVGQPDYIILYGSVSHTYPQVS